MEVQGSTKLPTSQTALRSIVERHLLREILEALFEAEWEHRGQMVQQVKTRSETLRIHTSLGRLYISVPHDPEEECPFRSQLLHGKKGKLGVPASSILALSFAEDAHLSRFLHDIYGEILPHTFVRTFEMRLASQLRAAQQEGVAREWSALYVGTVSLSHLEGNSDALELDYCIGKHGDHEYRVLGLWDPGDHLASRWDSIRKDLQARGLRGTRSIITDNASGLADAFLKLISTEEELQNQPPTQKDTSDDAVDGFANDDTLELDPPILLSEVVTAASDSCEMPLVSQPPIPSARQSSRGDGSHVKFFLVAALLGLTVSFAWSYLKRNEVKTVSAPPALGNVAAQVNVVPVSERLTPIERQLLKALSDQTLSADSLSALIRVASVSESKLVTRELIKLGSHPDAFIRIAVAKALAQSSPVWAAESKAGLYRLLNDADFLVRGFAAQSLARIGGVDASAALLLRLKSEDNEVLRPLLERLALESARIVPEAY